MSLSDFEVIKRLGKYIKDNLWLYNRGHTVHNWKPIEIQQN